MRGTCLLKVSLTISAIYCEHEEYTYGTVQTADNKGRSEYIAVEGDKGVKVATFH